MLSASKMINNGFKQTGVFDMVQQTDLMIVDLIQQAR
jgi:hypothetical protein